MDGERNWMYDILHDADRLSAVDLGLKCWMYRGCYRAVLSREVATYVDMCLVCCTEEELYAYFDVRFIYCTEKKFYAYVDIRFIRCIEKEIFANRLTLLVQNVSEVAETVPATDNLEYVLFPRAFESLHPLAYL